MALVWPKILDGHNLIAKNKALRQQSFAVWAPFFVYF
nr:MAG TPA: hypothetical protein [Caudoviricetes sp.]